MKCAGHRVQFEGFRDNHVNIPDPLLLETPSEANSPFMQGNLIEYEPQAEKVLGFPTDGKV